MSKNTNWAHTWWPPIGDHMEAKPTITEFLEARIAEDERYAYHALGLLGAENPWWTWQNLKARFESLSRTDAQHIERHGPRRVMAECAAKRSIFIQHSELDPCEMDPRFTVAHRRGALSGMNRPVPCTTIRALASAYSDHPDYQPEWSMS